MKKLRLYDHLGNLVMEHDVFVEGQDFTWVATMPTAVWFGGIALVDEKLAVKFTDWKDIAEEVVQELEPEKEVIIEPEILDNQSVGDKGTDETSQHESLEVIPEKKVRRRTHKRDKRTGKFEAA